MWLQGICIAKNVSCRVKQHHNNHCPIILTLMHRINRIENKQMDKRVKFPFKMCIFCRCKIISERSLSLVQLKTNSCGSATRNRLICKLSFQKKKTFPWSVFYISVHAGNSMKALKKKKITAIVVVKCLI